MYEYAAFNPFNTSPEAMAAELTKKSADGWEVVSIVTTFDGRYCAFLRRQTGAAGRTVTAPAAIAATATSVAPTASTSNAPAAWYADPSGRYELRYWDGSEWTEHVARGGQQFVDPPVA
jgi:hypothetical protein